MYGPGWEMKENGSSASKMINRNWVLKRKRRKLPCGTVIANSKEDSLLVSESPKNSSSVKRELKSDIKSERFSSKKKGNDGVSYVLCIVVSLSLPTPLPFSAAHSYIVVVIIFFLVMKNLGILLPFSYHSCECFQHFVSFFHWMQKSGFSFMNISVHVQVLH